MMKFKYLDNHLTNSHHSDAEIKCDVCTEMKICNLIENGGLTKKHDPDLVEQVCYECIHQGKLHRDTVLCAINQMAFFEDLTQMYPNKSRDEILEMKDDLQFKIECETPQVATWNGAFWPWLDGDFAKLIGFGSKPLLDELSDGDGANFYKSYLADIDAFEFSELPEEVVTGIKEAANLFPVSHVFKSINGDNYVIVWGNY